MKEAAGLDKQIGDAHHKVIDLNALGNVYLQHERYKEAEIVLKEAIGLAEQIGNILSQSKSLYVLSSVYLCEGRYEDAEKVFKKLLKIYRVLGNDKDVLRVKNSLHNIKWLKRQSIVSLLELLSKQIEEQSKKIEEIQKGISNHDRRIRDKLDRLEFMIGKIEQHIRDEQMDLVREVQELNELQLDYLKNIISEKLDEIQDVSLRKRLKTQWQRARETLSIAADFVTLVSAAVAIYNVVSEQHDIASAATALQSLITRIRDGIV